MVDPEHQRGKMPGTRLDLRGWSKAQHFPNIIAASVPNNVDFHIRRRHRLGCRLLRGSDDDASGERPGSVWEDVNFSSETRILPWGRRLGRPHRFSPLNRDPRGSRLSTPRSKTAWPATTDHASPLLCRWTPSYKARMVNGTETPTQGVRLSTKSY